MGRVRGALGRARPPMFVLAIVLIALLATLATLQYQWLGQISQADRDRRLATLRNGVTEFALDFDREVTRAYLLFQIEPGAAEDLAARFAARYDQWQATSRFPRLIKEFYIFSDEENLPQLRRFDSAGRRLESAEWPASMSTWREHLIAGSTTAGSDTKVRLISRVSQPIWESVPAIVAPMPVPLLFFSDKPPPPARLTHAFSSAVLVIDTEYVKRELLPTLAEQHFRTSGDEGPFQVAVVRTAADRGVIFNSSHADADADHADATADLLQVRTQDFTNIAAEVRRFTTFTATLRGQSGAPASTSSPAGRRDVFIHEARPLSIVVQQGPNQSGSAATTAGARITAVNAPTWRLVVRHPAGSLDAAVEGARRRNLAVSMSVLGVLGAAMGLLVLSTRRAQKLARQQMEFVAAVSHELRTPLAVIRSAAENLADGVVHDDEQIRKYGDLMRTEGRRLTEMVEQILELAGIQSGQRGFALRAVRVEPLLQDVIDSSSSLLREAAMEVEMTMADDLPPVLGDELSLRRVFQNLIGNALKYGADGGWIGVSATRSGSDVRIVVADRGIGIAPADQARIFEPFYRGSAAVEGRIQGAGLGLSLVQRIVEAHGGRVSVISAPGAGSEFIVQLPAAGEEPVSRRAAAPHPTAAPAGGQSDS